MPDLVYNVKFNIQAPQTGGGISQISQQAEAVGQSFSKSTVLVDSFGNTVVKVGGKASEAMDRVSNSTKAFNNVLKSGATTQKNANAQIAIGNQALFSFSDLTQDATQFSYGFATGMRAIGNNIGFTAELLAIYGQKIKEANNGTFTWGAAIKGLVSPVGLAIFGINALVTLITVFSRSAEQAAKSSESMSDKVFDLANNSMSFLSAESLAASRRADILQKVLDKNTVQTGKAIVATNDLSSAQIGLRESVSDVTAVYQAQNETALQGVGEIQALQIAEKRAADERRDAVLSVIREKLAEAEATKLIREEIESLGIDTLEQFALREKLAKMEQDAREMRAELRIADIKRIEQEEIDSANRLMDLIRNPPDAQAEDADESRIIRRGLATQQALLQLETREAATRSKTVADIELEYARRLEQERYKLLAQGITDRAVLDQLEITNEAEKNAAIEQMNRMRLNNEYDLAQQAVAGVSALLRAGFDDNKAVAIAETLISTYLAAQKAYASQMTLTPDSPIRAQIAAAAAVASGLARLASIKKTQIGSTGGDSSSSGSFGFTETQVQGAQQFRTPGFVPTAPSSGQMMTPKVEILADRKQLYYIVKTGEEEYRNIKAS